MVLKILPDQSPSQICISVVSYPGTAGDSKQWFGEEFSVNVDFLRGSSHWTVRTH